MYVWISSDILKLDHLWMMTSLVKLKLGNNIIEKIEGLSSLVNLKELDLSFNNIEVIEGLEELVKLEVLTLFENRISKLENMETLVNLMIFSIGNNLIEDRDDVSKGYVEFEVFTVVVMNVAIFWDIVPCSLYVNQHFGGAYHFHPKDQCGWR
jgi:hypothetical protein